MEAEEKAMRMVNSSGGAVHGGRFAEKVDGILVVGVFFSQIFFLGPKKIYLVN